MKARATSVRVAGGTHAKPRGEDVTARGARARHDGRTHAAAVFAPASERCARSCLARACIAIRVCCCCFSRLSQRSSRPTPVLARAKRFTVVLELPQPTAYELAVREDISDQGAQRQRAPKRPRLQDISSAPQRPRRAATRFAATAKQAARRASLAAPERQEARRRADATCLEVTPRATEADCTAGAAMAQDAATVFPAPVERAVGAESEARAANAAVDAAARAAPPARATKAAKSAHVAPAASGSRG